MKVGDLVTYRSSAITGNFVGLIIEVGQWTGNCDVKVSWCHEKANKSQTCKSSYLEVVNESR